MKHNVDVSPLAQKQIRRIRDKELQSRLLAVMTELGAEPRPPGTKKLVAQKFWRVRVGNWRIVYDMQDQVLVIVVITLGVRADVHVKLGR